MESIPPRHAHIAIAVGRGIFVPLCYLGLAKTDAP